MSLQALPQVNPYLNRDNKPAFRDGEVITYAVSYSSKVFSMNVADVEMRTTREHVDGHDCYVINAAGSTRPFYSVFFTLSDVYTSYLDARTLKPYRATSNQKEGGYMYETDFRFDWNQRKANTMGHNIKKDRYYRHSLSLGEFSYDGLSLFYNLRSVDISQAKKVGDLFASSLVLEDTVRTIYLKYLGREKMKASRKLGTFNTLKFSCVFATSTDDAFQDGTEFFVWITDDQNKIPVYLESPIRVGKVYATLSGYKGLANPVTSKCKE